MKEQSPIFSFNWKILIYTIILTVIMTVLLLLGPFCGFSATLGGLCLIASPFAVFIASPFYAFLKIEELIFVLPVIFLFINYFIVCSFRAISNKRKNGTLSLVVIILILIVGYAFTSKIGATISNQRSANQVVPSLPY